MVGLLIPAHYKAVKPDPNDMNIASIAWGVSMGVCIFTAAKGARQTINSWKRGRKMNPYIILLWMEWSSSTIMSAMVWSYLRGYIEPGFIFFFMVGTSAPFYSAMWLRNDLAVAYPFLQCCCGLFRSKP